MHILFHLEKLLIIYNITVVCIIVFKVLGYYFSCLLYLVVSLLDFVLLQKRTIFSGS